MPFAVPTRLRRPPTTDLLLAAGLVTALLFITPHVPPDRADQPSADAFALTLVAVAAGSLAFRRVVPRVALAVTITAVSTYALADYPGGPVYLTTLVALFTLATLDGRRAAVVPAAVTAVVPTLAGLLQQPTYAYVLIHLGWASATVATVLLGDAVRTQARMQEETREEEARRRVAEERVRIARDLHDVVAHSLASISIQAGVAAHVIDRRPDEARAALGAIKQASNEALRELRATLGVLRDGEGAPVRPTAGLADLSSLTAVAKQAGVPVAVEVAGLDDRHLPSAVDVTAYRIVQESLTNVMRHAGPARVQVRVSARDEVVEIEVVDDGRGASLPGPTGGHGIVGMCERAALIGGRVTAGPRSDGRGFRVHAVLPVPDGSPDSVGTVRA